MKILIIQLRRIGDILLTTPVLPYINAALPDASIDFLTEPMGKSVLETNPYINELLIYDKNKTVAEILRIRNRHYDVVFDFFSNPRTRYLCALSGIPQRVAYSAGFRSIFYNIRSPQPPAPEYVPKRKVRLVQYWLAQTGKPIHKAKSYRPSLHLTNEDLAFADSWMAKEKLSPRRFGVLAPASRRVTREWGWEKYRALALDIIFKGKQPVYLAWGPGEEEVMAKVRRGVEDKIGMLPKCSMREMGALLKNASFLVANDSGPVHLAVSVNTPTVTLYGPTRPVDWNPSFTELESGHTDRVLQAAGVDCLGCHLNECSVGHLCMEKLDVNFVYNACHKIMEQEKVK